MNPMRDFVVGEWVVLKGISRHGKQRIDQHGKEWQVRDMRWVHINDDPDFVMINNFNEDITNGKVNR